MSITDQEHRAVRRRKLSESLRSLGGGWRSAPLTIGLAVALVVAVIEVAGWFRDQDDRVRDLAADAITQHDVRGDAHAPVQAQVRALREHVDRELARVREELRTRPARSRRRRHD